MYPALPFKPFVHSESYSIIIFVLLFVETIQLILFCFTDFFILFLDVTFPDVEIASFVLSCVQLSPEDESWGKREKWQEEVTDTFVGRFWERSPYISPITIPQFLKFTYCIMFFIMNIQAINMSTSPYCPHLDRASSFKSRSLTLTRPQIILFIRLKPRKG